jgi:hypothetical protein
MLYSLQDHPLQLMDAPFCSADLDNKSVLVLQADFYLGNPLGRLVVQEGADGELSVNLEFEWRDRRRPAMVMRRFHLTELQLHRLIPCDLPSVANFEYAGVLREGSFG